MHKARTVKEFLKMSCDDMGKEMERISKRHAELGPEVLAIEPLKEGVRPSPVDSDKLNEYLVLDEEITNLSEATRQRRR